ncbi:tRNA/rRNA methyltransferase [Zophobihabitans entericus]|uniref:tRNA/rRNA methyltransferase n=1 Tax=Zophobihabitans entericus TaxID=1635327 RepID=A0A6G9IF55_9GAMM|nr:tRNA/rRNA methyltransferase [Zophobihabitans entericus]QIQ22230.1 tRNA/rRNA methyltransferase [Zophobihabitans entericus]
MSDNEKTEKSKPTVFYTQKKSEDTSGKKHSDRRRKPSNSKSDKPYQEKLFKDRGSKDKSFNDDSSKSRNYKDRPSKDRAYAARASDDKPYKDKPYGERSGKDRPYSDRSNKDRPYQDRQNKEKNIGERSSRIETFQPSAPREERKYQKSEKYSNDKHSDEQSDSPWKSRVRKQPQLPTFETDDTESLEDEWRRQQKREETTVYSENSCKAIFKKRPDDILKVFLVQEMTTKFRDLVMWLAEQRKGYDVISDDEMAKIAGTPHHGGVCFIVKKRQVVLATDYFKQVKSAKVDCVLAVDDINNPHNLGGLIRSATFFNVNGVILRQTQVFDSGSALRVAEGGAEYVTPIRADDLAVTLTQFKQQGYQITALLPCKMKAIESEVLQTVKLAPKTVFVLFQQVNTILLKQVDNVVYLAGNQAMPSLNISVATGILLAQWQQQAKS